jgi:hypothetical protein
MIAVAALLLIGQLPPLASEDRYPVEKIAPALTRVFIIEDAGTHRKRTFIGQGIALDCGHVLVPLEIFRNGIPEDVFLGDGSTRGKLAATDFEHALVVIRPDKTVPFAALQAEDEKVGKDHYVYVIGHVDLMSQPPMVERRVFYGRVLTPRYEGLSLSGLDLTDVMIVQAGGAIGQMTAPGAGVFSQQTGKLIGVVIGRLKDGGLIAVPSRTIHRFMTGFHAP